MSQYWIMVEGSPEGPYDAESLVKTKGFNKTTYVFRDGDQYWRTARELGFFGQIPTKAILSGDRISPDFHFLPSAITKKTKPMGRLNMAMPPAQTRAPKLAPIQKTKASSTRKPIPVASVKRLQKFVSVVAVFMMMAVIVHGSPMSWVATRFWMGQIHSTSLHLKSLVHRATFIPNWHLWTFADPDPVILRPKPLRLQRLKRVPMRAVPLPVHHETVVGRKKTPVAKIHLAPHHHRRTDHRSMHHTGIHRSHR